MPPFTDVEPGVATYIDADFTKHAPHTRKKLDGYRNNKVHFTVYIISQ